MKKNLIYIASIFLKILTSCGDLKEKTEDDSSDKLKSKDIFTTPINYDYDNLRLRLNSSIDDTASNIDWRWDNMNSDNGIPDTTGIDHYMNISQPVFSFNGEATLPSLSITTDRKKITRFSSTIIFHLENEKSESIENLLDSLAIIKLLRDTKIRQSVISNHNYTATYENFEETIELQISEDEYGYDRITYEIKITPHNTVYSK
ncbi:MAG: hypothetical protein ACI87N_002392 [Flavobacteriales bacterium]|jgi:hypothetical protein